MHSARLSTSFAIGPTAATTGRDQKREFTVGGLSRACPPKAGPLGIVLTWSSVGNGSSLRIGLGMPTGAFPPTGPWLWAQSCYPSIRALMSPFHDLQN